MKASGRPSTDVELLSQLDERVRRLEQAKSVALGPWVVTVNQAGQLVARHTDGTVQVLAPREA